MAHDRLDLVVAEPYPDGWEVMPPRMGDRCKSNQKRRGSIRRTIKGAAGRWESSEWVEGYLNPDPSPNASRESRGIYRC